MAAPQSEILSIDDIPEPHCAPEPIDPELERLLSWFIQNRARRLAWHHGAQRLAIDTMHPVKNDPSKYQLVVIGI